MDAILLIGRILFAAIFLAAGIGHFTQREAMAGYTASKGVPFPVLSTLGSGVLLVVGGLSVALGIYPDLGALTLVAAVAPIAVLMHPYWRESDAQARQTEQTAFMKDLSLLGAAVLAFALFAGFGDQIGLTITDTVVSIS